jgi:hypothetical protein
MTLGLKRICVLAAMVMASALTSFAQDVKTLPVPDERYKLDILLVVAHPDDEAAATAYLAKAMDEGKRAGVAYGTRGSVTGDIFEGITPGAIAFARPQAQAAPELPDVAIELAGQWNFYAEFRRAHGLENLPASRATGDCASSRDHSGDSSLVAQ